MQNSQEKINWLRLVRSENIGKSTFFRLINLFGNVQTAIEKVPFFAREGGLKREIKLCSAADAEAEYSNTVSFGADIIIFTDKKYPQLLREIHDPAPLLTIKGDVDFFNRDAVAIVGPRNASFGAISFAKKIALELGQNSITTVSGMARGVDTAVHEASILSGTIAVIAGGINNIYPPENKKIYEEIAQNGLLVSENPFGAPPIGGNFVQRNRIISGLSLGVVVVEAGLRSGSLTTARYAIEQGREVFAVPGSPFDPRCHGTNRLIKDGAKMVETVYDILEDLGEIKARFSRVGMLAEPETKAFIAPAPKMPSDDDIKKVREEIFTRLSFVPIDVEEIIEEMHLPPRLVNIALVQLELAEKVEVRFGKVALKQVK